MGPNGPRLTNATKETNIMFPLHGGLVLRPMVGDPLRAKKMLHFYFPGLDLGTLLEILKDQVDAGSSLTQ